MDWTSLVILLEKNEFIAVGPSPAVSWEINRQQSEHFAVCEGLLFRSIYYINGTPRGVTNADPNLDAGSSKEVVGMSGFTSFGNVLRRLNFWPVPRDTFL